MPTPALASPAWRHNISNLWSYAISERYLAQVSLSPLQNIITQLSILPPLLCLPSTTTMADLDPSNLFNVKGLVAVITGGGTGTEATGMTVYPTNR
jgi:hypothetical protein